MPLRSCVPSLQTTDLHVLNQQNKAAIDESSMTDYLETFHAATHSPTLKHGPSTAKFA